MRKNYGRLVVVGNTMRNTRWIGEVRDGGGALQVRGRGGSIKDGWLLGGRIPRCARNDEKGLPERWLRRGRGKIEFLGIWWGDCRVMVKFS